MTDTSESNFFATQIHQAQNQEEKQTETQKPTQQQHQGDKNQERSDNNQDQQSISLKKLLEIFNSYDKHEKGVITLQQCQQIISQFESIPKMTDQKLEFYYKLSLPTNQKACTFDEFLFVMGLCQNDIESRSTDDQYEYCKNPDLRIIDFMRLLNNYRKKCEKQSVYQEAKKSKKKVQEIRAKQYDRRKNFMGIIHNRQLETLQARQREKFIQFCQTWDEFMNEYQSTATELIKKLNQRQVQQIKEFVQKTKQQLASKIRYSKQIVELQDLQKKLVKTQQYEKADKVRLQIQQLKIIESHKKQREDLAKVQLRAQTVRKQHLAIMNTLLQKIQKDRNDQSRQRMSDSQKLIVKNKNLINEIKHKHNEALKKLYQNLHNITIDQSRLGVSQPNQRSRSVYNSNTKQRN